MTIRARQSLSSGGRPNTVGLGDQDLAGVLGQFESEHNGAASRGVQRLFARWPFARISIPVTIVHPGGTRIDLSMACRNLSRGGIGLLHGAYMYPGSRVTVLLPRLDGRDVVVHGVVARCEHRRGIIHEIGVRFDREIRLRDHVRPDVFTGWVSHESVDPDRLAGSVLHIDPTAMDQRMVRHFLRDTAITLRTAVTGEEGLASARSGCDVIVCEQHLPDMGGGALVRRLRGEGNATPVLLVGVEPTGAARQDVLGCGANGFLAKPFAQDAFVLGLAEFLLGGPGEDEAGPQAAPASELAAAYTERLVALAGELERLVTQGRPIDAYVVCSQIKGIAPSLGFAALADRAEWLASRLSTGEPLQAITDETRELVRACRDLRVKAP